jgi:hypothetical protein
MAKIIYEPHPISPARKAKLQAEGYKIIDAIFAPAGTPVHQKLDVEEIVTKTAEVIAEEVVAAAEPDIDEAIEKLDEAVEEYIAEVSAKRKNSKKVK